MYKACSRCGKVHDTKYKCSVKRKYNYNNEERKLRNTNKWHKKSLQVREKSRWLCAVCFEEGIYTFDNLEVHHIVKLKEDKTKLLDDYNLICLCSMHHKLADEGKISAEHLLELAKKRENDV